MIPRIKTSSVHESKYVHTVDLIIRHALNTVSKAAKLLLYPDDHLDNNIICPSVIGVERHMYTAYNGISYLVSLRCEGLS